MIFLLVRVIPVYQQATRLRPLFFVRGELRSGKVGYSRLCEILDQVVHARRAANERQLARFTDAFTFEHREDFIFLKDPSTARQIIEQTGIELKRLTSKQSRIASVQMLLSELGYDTTNPDGILGPKTKRAILRFQRKNAIRVDGQVSPRLLAKVERKRNALKSRKKKARSRRVRRRRATQPLNSEQDLGD